MVGEQVILTMSLLRIQPEVSGERPAPRGQAIRGESGYSTEHGREHAPPPITQANRATPPSSVPAGRLTALTPEEGWIHARGSGNSSHIHKNPQADIVPI